MQLITIRNSIQLAFDTFGAKESPLVLLVSGAGSPGEFWPNDFCQHIADAGRFVVRYSHRDTGHSTHSNEHYSIEELLKDMKSLISAFNNPEVHLVGHSMGGYLVQMAICRFPGEFISATSISAGPTVSPTLAAALDMSSAPVQTWQILMRNQPKGDFDQDLPGWLASWRFLNGSRPFDDEFAIRYTRLLYVGDPRNAQLAANHIYAMSTVPNSLVKELKKVVDPLLVIHGPEDHLVPLDNGEATARLVPNSKMNRLQGAGHMFFNRETWDEIGRSLIVHTNKTRT